jgi:hypothetical protein
VPSPLFESLLFVWARQKKVHLSDLSVLPRPNMRRFRGNRLPAENIAESMEYKGEINLTGGTAAGNFS